MIESVNNTNDSWLIQRTADSIVYRCPFCGATFELDWDSKKTLSDITKCAACEEAVKVDKKYIDLI